jgi:hypothetical protein
MTLLRTAAACFAAALTTYCGGGDSPASPSTNPGGGGSGSRYSALTLYQNTEPPSTGAVTVRQAVGTIEVYAVGRASNGADASLITHARFTSDNAGVVGVPLQGNPGNAQVTNCLGHWNPCLSIPVRAAGTARITFTHPDAAGLVSNVLTVTVIR